MKIGIVIITFNLDTRIFLLQQEAIKKFCTDANYEVNIYDNSSNEEMGDAIRHHAKEQNVNYYKTNPGVPDPSVSHCFAANYSYLMLKEEYDIMFYLDHDIIPLQKFSVEELLSDKLICCVKQVSHGGTGNIIYPWVGFFIFKNSEIDKSLVDFSPSHEHRLDTGGGNHVLIDKYGIEQCIFLEEQGCQNPYLPHLKKYYFYILINKIFMHFLNASNWSDAPQHTERINSLINIAVNKIAEYDLRKSE